MHFKTFLAACFLAASLCSAQTTVSIAPDAASKEDVRKLFDVMLSRDQMNQMMHQLFAQMQSISREQIKKKHPEITDRELGRMDRESEDLIKHFPLEAMLDDMVPVYQKHFTKSDIEAVTAFYSSPSGQKFLRELPAVTSETMQAVYPRIQKEVDAVMQRAEEKADAPTK
jgi:uncharacterized protein